MNEQNNQHHCWRSSQPYVNGCLKQVDHIVDRRNVAASAKAHRSRRTHCIGKRHYGWHAVVGQVAKHHGSCKTVTTADRVPHIHLR